MLRKKFPFFCKPNSITVSDNEFSLVLFVGFFYPKLAQTLITVHFSQKSRDFIEKGKSLEIFNYKIKYINKFRPFASLTSAICLKIKNLDEKNREICLVIYHIFCETTTTTTVFIKKEIFYFQLQKYV